MKAKIHLPLQGKKWNQSTLHDSFVGFRRQTHGIFFSQPQISSWIWHSLLLNLPKLLLRSRHLLRLQNCQKRMSYSVKRVFRLVWRPAFHGHFGAFGVVYVHTSKLAAKGFVCCFVLNKTPKREIFCTSSSMWFCLSFVVRFLSGNGCGCRGDWTARPAKSWLKMCLAAIFDFSF